MSKIQGSLLLKTWQWVIITGKCCFVGVCDWGGGVGEEVSSLNTEDLLLPQEY